MEMILNETGIATNMNLNMDVVEKVIELEEQEYYYYDVDDDGFDHYISTTRDPGPWLLIGVCIYSTFCFLLLPILVANGKKVKNGQLAKKDVETETIFDESFESDGGGGKDLELVVGIGTTPISSPVQCPDKDQQQMETEMEIISENKTLLSEAGNSDYSPKGEIKLHVSSSSKSNTRSHKLQKLTPPSPPILSHLSPIAKIQTIPKKKQKRFGKKNGGSYLPVMWEDEDTGGGSDRTGSNLQEIELEEKGDNIDFKCRIKTIDITTKDNTANQHQGTVTKNLFPEKRSIQNTLSFSSSSICAKIFGVTRSEVLETLHDIIRSDTETRLLFKLGIPFTFSAISDSFFDALTLLLISRYLHVHAVSAFVVSNLLLGITSSLIWGFLSTLETLCSHAMGTENHKLAGQYVQIAMLLFAVSSVPFLGVWWFYIEVCLEWFGLSEVAVEIGTQYAKVTIFSTLVEGLYEGFELLPDISGYEVATTIYGLVTSVIDIVLLWLLLANVEGFDLYWIGVMHLVEYVVVFALFGVASVWFGWFEPYWEGMTGTFAFKNTEAVKNVVKAAIPLSLGSLLEYGEWQILTIFVAILGPAEVAAWGIMEAIWELFEAAVDGFCEAGSVRLALRLGEGNIPAAKKTAWKSLFVTTCLASFVTGLFFLCGDQVAIWFTDDHTLQLMIAEMIPLVGFCNIFMAFGAISEALVEAQGLYMHSTMISAIVSFFITIPLSAFSCLVMHYELKSLVGALLVGYSTTTLCLAYLLFTSDWHTISKNIIENIEEEDDDESSSDESCSNMVKYEDFDWKELPEDARNAAELLGYNKKMWNKDKEPKLVRDSDWDDLTNEQQAAATVLGYTAGNWSDDDSSSDEE